MEKSIETVWKQGFVEEASLGIPKVTNLYNRKSIHLMDKLMRMMKLDLWSTLPVAVIVGGWLAYSSQSLWVGLVTFLTCLALFFVAKSRIDALEKLEKGQSCYHYLQSVKQWIQDCMRFYTRLLGIGAPVFVLVIHLILMNFPGDNVLSVMYERLGFEGRIWFIGLTMTVASVVGVLFYRLSVKLVYGGILSRLNSLIADMNELRIQG